MSMSFLKGSVDSLLKQMIEADGNLHAQDVEIVSVESDDRNAYRVSWRSASSMVFDSEEVLIEAIDILAYIADKAGVIE